MLTMQTASHPAYVYEFVVNETDLLVCNKYNSSLNPEYKYWLTS